MKYNLNLLKKFNFLLLIILIIGCIVSGLGLSLTMQNKAEKEIMAKAEMLIHSVNSVRKYTSEEIQPLLSANSNTNSQSVSDTLATFGATQVFENFRQDSKYKNFLYKEVALDSINPEDKPDKFEINLINKFRKQPQKKQLTGYRKISGEKLFYITRPLAIAEDGTTFEKTSPGLTSASKNNNGLNQKSNEIF